MSSTHSQVEIAEANHTLPTRQSAYRDGASSDPFIKEFLAIEKTAVAVPAIPLYGDLFDEFDPNVRAALDGRRSPEDALDAVAASWKKFLASSGQ
ncbi:MAG: hypothetical protein ACLP0J_13095 [Solirubrobacteraceae bacterium]